MDIKELRKLVKFARKQGILKLKMNGLEVELSQNAISPTNITRSPKLEQTEPPQKQYTENDVLFWSTQNLDPIGEAQ